MSKSADKLFTLDVVDTSQTQTIQEVSALKQASRDVGTSRLIEGLQSFGAGISAVAQEKKKDEIVKQKRTAVQYAIRNEVLPNGFRKEAIQAYDDVIELHGLDKIEKEVANYYNGDEYKQELENPLLSPEIKIRNLEKTNADFLLRASRIVNNPTTLQKYRTNLKRIEIEQIKEIYIVDRMVKDTTSIQTMQNQIQKRVAAGLELSSDYIVELGKSFHVSNPWNKLDQAKLTAFNLVVNDESMDSVKLNDIMSGKFYKDVTFKALANANTTDAGKEIRKIFDKFHSDKRTKFERIQQEEVRQTKLKNDEAEKAADKFLEDNPDNPNRYAQVEAIMEAHGAEKNTIRTYLSIHSAVETLTKLDTESAEHLEVELAVVTGEITNRSELGQRTDSLNLNGDSYKRNAATLAAENTQFEKNIAVLKEDVGTINSAAVSAINAALSPLGKAFILSDRFAKASKEQQAAMLLSGGKVQADYATKMPAIIALQDLRTAIAREIQVEARRAATKNEDPNADKIRGKFESRLAEIISDLESGRNPLAPKSRETPTASGAVTIEPPKVIPEGPDITSTEKEQIIKAVSGTSEDKEVVAQSFFSQITEKLTTNKDATKTFEPKTFRQRTEEAAIDKAPFVPPTKPKEKPKEKPKKDILGVSSILSLTDRAKIIAANPESQRYPSSHVKEEIIATGEIAEKEDIIATEIATTFGEAKQAVIDTWTNFTDFFKTVEQEPTEKTSQLKDKIKETKEIKPSDVSPKKPSPDTTIDIAPFSPPLETFSEDFIGEMDTQKGLRPLEAIEPTFTQESYRKIL